MSEQFQVFFLSLYKISKILMVQIKKINIKKNTQHKVNDAKQRDEVIIKKNLFNFFEFTKDMS
jgi:hypothetical protein